MNARLDRIGDYPFDRLRALIGDTEPPRDVVPIVLSIGEPAHAPPRFVREIIDRASDGWSRYPPMRGSKEVRQAVAEWLRRRYGLSDGMVDPDSMIVPVSGTREALFMMALATVPEQKNDLRPLALMPDPFYQVYHGAATLAGARSVFVPAGRENGFLPDYAGLPEDILARTAIAYFCSPANPQGTIASLDTLKSLVILAREFDFLLVSDECYSELYYGDPPPGMVEACEALGGDMSNVVVMNSLSKRSSVPGLRVGFALGAPETMRRYTRLRDYGGAPPPLPLLAAASALWRDEDHVAANRALYAAKFNLAEERLAGRLGHYTPDGGFYLWLDTGDGEAAALRLWQEAGLRVMPGEYLSHGADGRPPGAGFIRVALVHDLDVTRDVVARLAGTL